jgi:hypothetical protein
VLLNGLILFPTLFKKDGIYYVWLKLSATSQIQSEAEYSLNGQKGSVSYTGKTFGIETTTSEVISSPEHILTFTNTHAKQYMTRDSFGRDILSITFKLADELKDFSENILTGAASAMATNVPRMKGNHHEISPILLFIIVFIFITHRFISSGYWWR